MKRKILIFFFSLTNVLYAFEADCTLKNAKHFHFSINNQVMLVDWKYKVFYSEQDNGWEIYQNKGYVYKIKNNYKDNFPIKVKNKKYNSFIDGNCVI